MEKDYKRSGKMMHFVAAITIFKNLINTNFRTLTYITLTTLIIFLCVDLTLGKICAKVYTPTKYGWSLAPNHKVILTVEDTKGNFRKITNEYFEHGFKRWPKATGSKPRVLIIGDSFTHMPYVSNGEEWYAYLERAFPDIAFYVFGASGYGTLQEYMVMSDLFNTIRPDAIIWQFCDNDYSNNYYEWDRRNYPLNNHFVRPYWENNTIVYRLPLPYPHMRHYSFTADRLLYVYDRICRRNASKNRLKLIEFYVEIQKNHPLQGKDMRKRERYEEEAVDVTKMLARKIRSLAGDIPIYFFKVDSKLTAEDRSITEAGHCQFVDGIGEHMQRIAAGGIELGVANDGHWNYNGNRHAGLKLAEYFETIGGIVPLQEQGMDSRVPEATPASLL